MDKSCNSSSADSTTTTVSSSNTTTTIHSITNNRDNNNNNQFLRNLNKFSHTISKPNRKPTFNPPPPPPPPPPQSQTENLQQHQPPVYNINKSDFRDVVQKLTGSPAHERFSTPPPIQQPKPPSSRLQRIRPPPLAQISNRPPPLLNCAARPQLPTSNPNNFGNQRAVAPLSPLPPFPTVHAAAESPISAYMRFLQNSIATVDSDPKRFSGLSPLAPLVSPRWSNPGHHQPPPVQSQNNFLPSPTSSFQMPTSPLPFGCFPSPRSPYPLFSPSTAGQLGFQPFPVSPRVPVPSPRWKDL